jgi:hypothetical protein
LKSKKKIMKMKPFTYQGIAPQPSFWLCWLYAGACWYWGGGVDGVGGGATELKA